MSIPRHIKEYLDATHTPYRHSIHGAAFTAQEIAHEQHVSGKQLAKTVIVLADDKPVMAVLPASHRLDLDALRKHLGAKNVRLAQEEEFEEVFPGCELGAMPPLGNLYRLSVCVDEALHNNPSLVFNAGSHTDTIEMGYADFERLVRPSRGRFAVLSH